MISTAQALAKVLSLVGPTSQEQIYLSFAHTRVLAETVSARRDSPPFAASAMDGYAIATADAQPGDRLKVIGEAAAGHGFDGRVAQTQTVRIFTGAPLPTGAERVIIQEDVSRDGDWIILGDKLDTGLHIRPAGGDFAIGDTMPAPRRLGPADIALLASMNIATPVVHRKPVIALIATGDELAMPGETPTPDQIIASNSFGLRAIFEAEGAEVRMLPIARDTLVSLQMAFELAADADLIVTIGGASVGDHDLVAAAAQAMGLDRAFYKVAMRPGKPLMAGRIGNAAMVGLPGNPVSAMVCGEIFIVPMIRKMLGLPARPRKRRGIPLAATLPANGPREHYMRAVVENQTVCAFECQDSALLSVLSQANALIVRPIDAPAVKQGEMVAVIDL